MEDVLARIVKELEVLDTFRYVNMAEVIFDRGEYHNSVAEELMHHLKGHSFSPVLLDQLIDISAQGFVDIAGYKHPYELFDIYNCIDKIVDGVACIKPFNRKSSKLYGKQLFHSHHSHNFYIMANCVRYIRHKYKTDKHILDRLSEIAIDNQSHTGNVAIFINEILLESITWDLKTGEWLVYQKVEDNYHFLCIYIHDCSDENDEILYNLIKNHLIV